jgi:Fe-S-cluster-containing hydrogenase component 2
MISKKKCTACHMCELACSVYHEGAYRPSVARLRSECNPTTAEIKGFTCLQTGCSKCQEVCPRDAIETRVIELKLGAVFDSKDRFEGVTQGHVLIVNEDKCDNCGDCYDVCPYGVIHPHPERKVAYKCDLCDGDPQCITFCQNPHVYAVDLKLDKADKAALAGA